VTSGKISSVRFELRESFTYTCFLLISQEGCFDNAFGRWMRRKNTGIKAPKKPYKVLRQLKNPTTQQKHQNAEKLQQNTTKSREN